MVAVGNVHSMRIMRFLIVLIVVLLTIFIYASYSTTTSLTHMRAAGPPPQSASLINLEAAPPALSQQQELEQQQHLASAAQSLKNHSNELNLASEFTQSQRSIVVAAETAAVKPKAEHRKTHRLPTIDADALNDGIAGGVADNNNIDLLIPDEQALERLASVNELIEEQYLQNVENLMGSISNNSANVDIVSKQQQQQQSVNEILIPTSNLQKFIENADKLLNNMANNTSNNASNISSSSPGAASVTVGTASQASQAALSNKQNDKEISQTPSASGSAGQKANDADQRNSPSIDGGNGEPLPPSAIMHIMGASSAAGVAGQPAVNAITAKTTSKNPKSNAVKLPTDPSKGIPTENIYEPGHMIDEVNIDRICPKRGVDLKLLILITSAQTHKDARLSIRQTWGHFGQRRDVSTAFILGRTTNETINKMLSQENYLYGDLIRGNFIDSYNNLTLKTISSLEFVDEYCSQAKFILKTDDDMFINVPKLLNFLDTHKDKRVIYGRLAKKWKPIRNKKSKYYVSPDQFPALVFPAFTTGPAYVFTSDTVSDLYKRSLKTVYLKLEDVFTTGIVAQQLGIKRVHINEFLNRRISFNPCNIRNAISVHMIKSNEQFDLWKKLLDQTTKCK